MKIFTESITCKSEKLLLTNHRAIFWETQSMLILSDIHIGKTAHFRKSGIPISSKVMLKDLERLDALIHHFNPKTLMVVGDLFHAEANEDVFIFHEWMKKHDALKMILVKGNHDKTAFELYENLNIEIINNSTHKIPFIFTHHTKSLKEDEFYISGHTHPGVSIKGKGRQRIKLPCYQVTEQQIILPAFSLFTGLNIKGAPKDCSNYAFTENLVFKV